ncbi:Lrp/AsnC family transcriptional regulator [Sulfitobacter sp. HNIBRBA3233]|uniref:Lrp/AsnC family transcriptional regulator n=1 Tax=Sulfitobacter marinivivus TaxID=3158558 RepID=UPI0032E017ED
MKRLALDAADIRILCALQQHGQMSKAKLAEVCSLSATPCWARLTRLKAAGYIRGYHADIALGQLADFAQVIVTVSLSRHRKADFDRFEAYVNGRDEIIDCIATGGGVDYIMKVVSASLTAFQEFVEDLHEADLGIDRYMTHFATRQVKTALPNISKLATARLK